MVVVWVAIVSVLAWYENQQNRKRKPLKLASPPTSMSSTATLMQHTED